LSAARHGPFLLPVARMGLAPLLDVSDVLRIPEVVAVGRFAKPAPLAGQFAGVLAGRLATVTLPLLVAVIGEEKLTATAALTSLRFQTHCEPKPPRSQSELKLNPEEEEGPARKKEEGI